MKKEPSELQKNSWKRADHLRRLKGARAAMTAVMQETGCDSASHHLSASLSILNVCIREVEEFHQYQSAYLKEKIRHETEYEDTE